MRNMLAFAAALTLTFIGVGWYLDWFTFRSTPAPAGRSSVTVDFNTQKISADMLKAEQKIQQKIAEKAKETDANTIPKPSQPLVLPKQSENLSIPGFPFSATDVTPNEKAKTPIPDPFASSPK